MWFKKKKLPPLRNIEQEINKKPNIPIKPNYTNPVTNNVQIQHPVNQPTAPEVHEVKHEEKHLEQQEPPLFIKLEKYRDIVTDIGNLKSSIALVKNSLIGIERLQKTQEETVTMLKKMVTRIEDRLNKLSSKIVKPSMFPMIPELIESPITPEETEDHGELSDLNTTIASLKSQIDQLKRELQTVSQ